MLLDHGVSSNSNDNNFYHHHHQHQHSDEDDDDATGGIRIVNETPTDIARVFEQNWTFHDGSFVLKKFAHFFTYDPLVLLRSKFLGIQNPRNLIMSGLLSDLQSNIYQGIPIRVSTGTLIDQFWIEKPGSKNWYRRLKKQVQNVIQHREDFDLVLLPDNLPIQNLTVDHLTNLPDYQVALMTYEGTTIPDGRESTTTTTTTVHQSSSSAVHSPSGSNNDGLVPLLTTSSSGPIDVNDDGGYSTDLSDEDSSSGSYGSDSEFGGAVSSYNDGDVTPVSQIDTNDNSHAETHHHHHQTSKTVKIPESEKEIRNFAKLYRKLLMSAVESKLEDFQRKLNKTVKEIVADGEILFQLLSSANHTAKEHLNLNIPGFSGIISSSEIHGGQSLSELLILIIIEDLKKGLSESYETMTRKSTSSLNHNDSGGNEDVSLVGHRYGGRRSNNNSLGGISSLDDDYDSGDDSEDSFSDGDDRSYSSKRQSYLKTHHPFCHERPQQKGRNDKDEWFGGSSLVLSIGSRYGISNYVKVVVSSINNTLKRSLGLKVNVSSGQQQQQQQQQQNTVNSSTSLTHYTVDGDFDNISSMSKLLRCDGAAAVVGDGNNNLLRNALLSQYCSAFVGKLPYGFDGYVYRGKRTRKSRKRNKEKSHQDQDQHDLSQGSAPPEVSSLFNKNNIGNGGNRAGGALSNCSSPSSMRSFGFKGFGKTTRLSSPFSTTVSVVKKRSSRYGHQKMGTVSDQNVRMTIDGDFEATKISISFGDVDEKDTNKKCTMFEKILSKNKSTFCKVLLKTLENKQISPIFMIPSDTMIDRRMFNSDEDFLCDFFSRTVCLPSGDNENEYISRDQSTGKRYRFSLRHSPSTGSCVYHPLNREISCQDLKEVNLICDGRYFRAFVIPIPLKKFADRR